MELYDRTTRVAMEVVGIPGEVEPGRLLRCPDAFEKRRDYRIEFATTPGVGDPQNGPSRIVRAPHVEDVAALARVLGRP